MSKEIHIPELDMSAFKKVGSTNLTNWQAVNELIANSIDSWILNAKRGKLEISIDLKPAIDLSDSEIIITDNASGMNKEDIIRCFNLFYSDKSKEKMSDKILGFFDLDLREQLQNSVMTSLSLALKILRFIIRLKQIISFLKREKKKELLTPNLTMILIQKNYLTEDIKEQK